MYADLVRMNEGSALDRAIDEFVYTETDRRLYLYSEKLIQVLRAHDIAPVLITGAPHDIAVRIAKRLGIDEVYGMTVRDGRVVHNTGTAEGKRKALALIDRRERKFVLGAGDSQSDMPLMKNTSIHLAAKSLAAHLPDSEQADTFEFSEATTSAELESWLLPRLPEPLFPRVIDDGTVRCGT